MADNTHSFKPKTVGHNLTAGSANVVYTCPANCMSKVVLLYVTNHGSGNKTLTVQWYDASTNTSYYILGGYILSAYGFLKMDNSYIVLHAGDTLTITPEALSSMSALLTVEEFYHQTLAVN